jgi:tRNA-splicing endonuclease subunit Sen15, fungi type
MSMPQQISGLPTASALSSLLASSGAKSSEDALALEVLHNLRHQHSWTELEVHPAASSTLKHSTNIENISLGPPTNLQIDSPITLLSGRPPLSIYTHPDFLAHLVSHELTQESFKPEIEIVIPLTLAEKWTLRRFCEVFDSLPEREPMSGVGGHKHQDAKRVLLAMMGQNGKGGDGTIVYYIMQEGDVKPRQN